MTFEETLSFLEKLSENRMRLDLAPSQQLLELIEYSPSTLPSVIVAGTNGKGSTCAFLTSMARSSGILVGTFTSPHLESVLERISIQGEAVDTESFANAASRLKKLIERNQFVGVTYFEFLTMTAVLLFRERKVDLAIFEVGLGGRLDTTNALSHLGCGITRIGLDHMNILGGTVEKIAVEKGAVMRPKRFAVIGPQTENVLSVLHAYAKTNGVPYLNADLKFLDNLPLGIQGDHQIENAAVAKGIAFELRKLGFPFSESSICKGLKEARNPGRLEFIALKNGKEIWLDVAHNRDSIDALVAFLKKKNPPLHLVLGMLQDKEWNYAITQLKEVSSEITYCKPASPRAWDMGMISPTEAFHTALQSSNRIVCTGSFYVVGEIRKLIQKQFH